MSASESILGSASDSIVAKSSLSTITASTTRTVREITRDGDGNGYYFNAFGEETRGGDPPLRRDSHDSTRSGEGDEGDAQMYPLRDQTREDTIRRKVPQQSETDQNPDGLVAQWALQPWAGGQGEGGAEEEEDTGYAVPVLPSGWEALADDDGAIFYHHIDSGVTQWEVPQQQ